MDCFTAQGGRLVLPHALIIIPGTGVEPMLWTRHQANAQDARSPRVLSVALWDQYYYLPHAIDEKTEPWSNEVTSRQGCRNLKPGI